MKGQNYRTGNEVSGTQVLGMGDTDREEDPTGECSYGQTDSTFY